MSDDRPPTRGMPRMRGYGYIDPKAIGIPTIDVYCQDSTSHAATRWDIATFVKQRGEWAILPPLLDEKRLRSPDDLVAIIDRTTKERVPLDMSIWPPPAEMNVYLRYSLRCTECEKLVGRQRAMHVPVTGDSLQPIFDNVFAVFYKMFPDTQDSPAVSLVELAAMLKRSGPR